MGWVFNAEEVFDIAIRIEENGGKFYRKAALLQSDAADREMLEKLAAVEDGHKQYFEKMKIALTDAEKGSTVFDPMDESTQYLAAMVDSHKGEGSPAAANALTGEETVAEILRIAIELEKESILFYLGLMDWVPTELEKDRLDQIIREERRHVVQLNAVLSKLR